MDAMRLAVALVAVLAVGCGPQWEGRYIGALSGNTSCTDNSGGAHSNQVDWQINEGTTLNIVTNGTCGTILADEKGTTATFRPKSCPVYSANGWTYLPTMSSGSITLDGDSLSAWMVIKDSVSGASTGTCTTTFNGNLIRKR